MLIFQMTEREITRKSEIPDVLETIFQLMEQLAVLDVLPHDLEQSEFVCNRALDVRSASMVYLAVSIRHHSIRGGLPGKLQSKFPVNALISEGSQGLLHRRRSHGFQSVPRAVFGQI